jgi:hypothetical protein
MERLIGAYCVTSVVVCVAILVAGLLFSWPLGVLGVIVVSGVISIRSMVRVWRLNEQPDGR